MKPIYRPLSAAIALLLIPVSGLTLSLGQSSGTVVFGRPLDLTVQARLDAPLDESSNCFSAEIFQGDLPFDINRVRIDVKAAANPLEASIRIRSAASITEPWAKVILRSNCGAKMSRQYDFLTDFMSDLPASMPNTRLPVVASTARDVQQPATTLPALTTLTSPATDIAAATKTPAARQKLARALVPKSTKPSAAAATTSMDDTTKVASDTPAVQARKLQSTRKLATKDTSVAEGKSRLKMETFDLADERQVMLKMSTALLAPVVSDSPANAQALAQAAAVWRALNAKPEDVAADVQKLQATAAELQSVKSAALKEQTNLQERLRMAEEKKFANPLVYGLLALLVLTLAGLTWMWLRLRKNAQAGYAWLGSEPTMPTYAEPLADTGIAEPTFIETRHMRQEKPVAERISAPAAYAVVQAIEETTTRSMEEIQDVVDAPSAPETLNPSMVFNNPVAKVDVHIDNNPLWPANAASATHSDGPAALVITPNEALMLPITQPDTLPEMPSEAELQAVPAQAVVQVDLPLKAPIAPPETLNIDLDFSKISPPRRRALSPVNNHIEFYSDGEHAKASQPAPLADQKEANLAAEPKPKSLPKLPKSVHKLHKPTATSPATSEQKTNLIDFESFANAPAPPRPSRFTS